MLKFLLSASVLAIVAGTSMPVAHAQYYDDEGSRVGRRHYDDDYRPSRRHHDDDDYYRPRRHRDDYDDDYHRHAPVIIIHPPSWNEGGGRRPTGSYGSNEHPSGGTWNDNTPRRPTTSGSTDNRPNWEKENRPPTQQEWNGPGGGYGGK